MSGRPLVSIVVPFYNAGATIDQTVASALAQTWPEVEVVVVDDGSTDEASIRTFDALSHPRLRTCRTANHGLSLARNTGILMARGEYVLPLDADDLISSTYVEKAIEAFQANPALGIVYSHACFFGDVNAYWPLPAYDPVDFLTANCIFASGVFRKSDWVQVGGYKADMRKGLEDYDFWLSLIGLGREVHRLPDVHFFYRKHGPSMISRMGQPELHAAYQRILARHRQLYADRTLDMIVRLNEQRREIARLKEALATAEAGTGAVAGPVAAAA